MIYEHITHCLSLPVTQTHTHTLTPTRTYTHIKDARWHCRWTPKDAHIHKHASLVMVRVTSLSWLLTSPKCFGDTQNIAATHTYVLFLSMHHFHTDIKLKKKNRSREGKGQEVTTTNVQTLGMERRQFISFLLLPPQFCQSPLFFYLIFLDSRISSTLFWNCNYSITVMGICGRLQTV